MRILPNNNATFMVLYIYCGLVLENNDLIYRIVLLIYRTKVLNLSINQNFTLFIMNNTIDFHQRSIWILKTKGPQPLCALAEELKVTMEGARFQLLKLEKEFLVKKGSGPLSKPMLPMGSKNTRQSCRTLRTLNNVSHAWRRYATRKVIW